jgi:hypothetical protein
MLFLLALGGGAYALMRRIREDGTDLRTGSGTTA